MTALQQTIDIRRSRERMATELDWLDSRHSFSFGQHYDPDNTHFGLLLVNNHDIVRPDTGFSTHPHRDMEIVTWIVNGELEHKDSEGHKGLIHPGLAQRMSAGSGIYHSEMNATNGGDVQFVQMWVVPDTAKVRPSYEERDISGELAKGGLVPVAAGRGHDAAISIRQDGAVLWAGRLKAGETVTIPAAPFAHLFVPVGSVELEGHGTLERGDAARMTLAGGMTLTAGAEGAEVLLWEMHGLINMGR